ncbi:MAG: hypothetical protein AAGG80_03855 [Pseudomonadota bacterium]
MNKTLKKFALNYIPGMDIIRKLKNRVKRPSDWHHLEYCKNYILAVKSALLLQKLQPYDSTNLELIRVGNEADGGYIMANHFEKIDAAYSFGIDTDVSWDKFIAEKSIPVFMYDHTIEALPEQHKNFHFFRTGLCGKPNLPNMKDIGSLLKENGHLGKNLLMKMDIEGYEYPAFDAMTDEEIGCFSQIVCEIHHLHDLFYNIQRHELISRCLKKILKQMYCVHIHANNVGSVACSNGIEIPSLLELTFVRKNLMQDFMPTDKLRHDLDRKNNPNLPSINISQLWKQFT